MPKSSDKSKGEEKRGRGQPTKLTPAIQKQIVKYTTFGVPRELAGAMEGVADRTLRKWLEWGEAEGAKEPYRSFAREMRKAEAKAGGKAAMRVYMHGKTDWRALAWWLRSRHAELFGDKIELNIKDGFNRLLDVAQRVLEPTQFAQLLAALTGEGGEGAPPQTGGGESDP